ncbi:MAG: hypothetical protein U1E64_12550 [Sphingomonadaceae bacterium]
MSWTHGYSLIELQQAQDRYNLQFPPDLVALLNERSPTDGYNWNTEDPGIREMLNWPYEMLLFDVENGFWWPSWGERPKSPGERAEALRDALSRAPRLIPIVGHRFIPETPHLSGNPVFSMYGFDTVYYGANLTEFFVNEFEGRHEIGNARHIPFWSSLVEQPELAYAFYEAHISGG